MPCFQPRARVQLLPGNTFLVGPSILCHGAAKASVHINIIVRVFKLPQSYPWSAWGLAGQGLEHVGQGKVSLLFCRNGEKDGSLLCLTAPGESLRQEDGDVPGSARICGDLNPFSWEQSQVPGQGCAAVPGAAQPSPLDTAQTLSESCTQDHPLFSHFKVSQTAEHLMEAEPILAVLPAHQQMALGSRGLLSGQHLGCV